MNVLLPRQQRVTLVEEQINDFVAATRSTYRQNGNGLMIPKRERRDKAWVHWLDR